MAPYFQAGSDFADTTVGAAGGIKGLEEYLAGQHIQYVEVKQAITLMPGVYTSYKCLCKIDGGIFYNPHTRYVVGVFKCLCGKGSPKLLTIKYKANKDGYSDGPVESDELELPPDTPVEAKEEKPGLCFISTTMYATGSEASLELLKGFRDDLVLSSIGRWLVNWYYGISPPIAQRIARSKKSKEIVKCIIDMSVALIKRRNAEKNHVIRAVYKVLIVQTYVFGCLVAKVLTVFPQKPAYTRSLATLATQ